MIPSGEPVAILSVLCMHADGTHDQCDGIRGPTTEPEDQKTRSLKRQTGVQSTQETKQNQTNPTGHCGRNDPIA